MLYEIPLSDVLVKTLKNEAKSHKKSSGLSHSEALDVVSQKYGFNQWKNVCELKRNIILCFTNDNIPAVKSTSHDRLIENGFHRIGSKAKIGQFVIEQRFTPPVGPIFKTLFEEWVIVTYLGKATPEFGSPEDVDSFILSELKVSDYYFVFKGRLYEQQDFQRYITDYDYLDKGDLS